MDQFAATITSLIATVVDIGILVLLYRLLGLDKRD